MGQFLKIFIDQFKFVSQYNNGDSNPAAFWMIILGVVAFFAFAMIVDRIIVLYKSRIDGRGYFTNLIKALERKDIDKAIALSKKRKDQGSPFAEIIYRGLRARQRNARCCYDFAVHEAKLELYPKMRKRTSFLMMIQSIATLLGLTGTIFGLILAFDAVGGQNPSESSRLLAAGISAAMNTTIGGLFIAIPTLIAASIISSRMNELIKTMDIYILKVRTILNINDLYC